MTTSNPGLVRAARLAWPAVAALLTALTLVSLPAAAVSSLTANARAELPAWQMTETGFLVAVAVVNLLPVAAYLVVTALIWSAARDSPIGLACAYMLTVYGVLVAGPVDGLAIPPGPGLVTIAVLVAAGQLSAPLFFFVFPTGRMPRALRWIAIVGALVVAALLVPDLLTGRAVTAEAVQSVGVLLFLAGIVVQVLRYRRIPYAQQRAQVRWVVYGLVLAAAVFIASRLLVLVLPESMRASEVGADLVGGGSVSVALAIVPVCIGIAVLRGGLWDVDRVVNRSAVYGLLSALVIAIYVLVATVLAAQIPAPSILTSLLATGVVALVLHPLQRALQRGVNRLMFGQRDEPAVVVAELGRRLQDTADADAVLATAAATLARSLKLSAVEVLLRDGTTVRWGAGGTHPSAPLVFQGQVVGELRVGERRPGEGLTAQDRELIAQVAPQIAAAADAVLLTRDLRASRARIVEAREDERRRLRRDLHDGLGPALAGLALQASAIPEVAPSDPSAAAALGSSVASGIRGVIADVRRLVYGLRPPALDELGLVGGLRAAADALEVSGGFGITIDAPDSLPTLPAAIEAAAYRIASEAMANAARHAGAVTCRVTVRVADGLSIEVADDGAGLPDRMHAGVGILGMRERAAEIDGTVEIAAGADGGTVVRARLPLLLPVAETEAA